MSEIITNVTNDEESVDFVSQIREKMRRHKFVLVYAGEFSQEVTKNVLSMAERNMDQQNAYSGLKKKVFNVMVEILQNICKHQGEVKDENGNVSAIFMIGRQGDDYIVISGNFIFNDKIAPLVERIDKVNSLDAAELKALYKERMRNGSISEVGGAGLGFIDMARKAGNKLIYEFRKETEEYSFYTLKVKISPKKKD